MERVHPRDITPPVARAAMASIETTTTAAASSNGLLRRGVRIARSMLLNPRCVTSQSVNTCEKPAQSTNSTLGILAAAGYVPPYLVSRIIPPSSLLTSSPLYAQCRRLYLRTRRPLHAPPPREPPGSGRVLQRPPRGFRLRPRRPP